MREIEQNKVNTTINLCGICIMQQYTHPDRGGGGGGVQREREMKEENGQNVENEGNGDTEAEERNTARSSFSSEKEVEES